ncbi:MAG: sulfotransferase domain-containing protein [Pseudomonadales bacterium]|nr:sulfotransferase domain-containing protein [Pseudomonadales bacterium]
MSKPDFVVIGAMKCATSTVCAYLEDHPDVFMPRNCEPRFFSDDGNWARGTEWYESLFRERREEAVCGEGSNDYTAHALHPHAAERMAAYGPELKLIYMVRHPVDRALSAWVQNRVDSGDAFPPTFREAIEEMPDRYVDQSLYWEQLSHYRTHFPDTQILIGFMEDMKRDQQGFFDALCRFLGVTPAVEAARPHQNPSAGKRVPSPLYSRVQALPFIDMLKAAVPEGLRKRVRDRVLSTPSSEAMQIPPETRARVEAQVRDDARALLRHCGKPLDYWSLG